MNAPASGTPPSRATLLYDGDCGFCRRWIERWRRITQDRVRYGSWQDIGEEFPDIPEADCQAAVQLIDENGQRYRAAEAVFETLSRASWRGLPLLVYRRIPLFARISEAAYAFVAGHRMAASRVMRFFSGKSFAPPTWLIARSTLLRGLGLIYLIAFVSLSSQLDGLIGANGIEPVSAFAERVHQVADQRSQHPYLVAPTLSLFNTSDAFLHMQCTLGIVLALVLMAGYLPGLSCAALWVLYLSLTVAGQTFLGFQWESLLLEAGFIAIFLHPPDWRIRHRESRPPMNRRKRMIWLCLDYLPQQAARLALCWLMFRLMFQSGLVKLASNDDVWWNLTALSDHYYTQPIPAWTSWYAHQLPAAFQKFSVGVTFVIEIAFPFLIFGPRNFRRLAAAGFIFLMLVIQLTGNYTYFNLLTALICVAMLDDACWPGWLQSLFQSEPSIHWTTRTGPKSSIAWLPASMVALLLTGFMCWTAISMGTHYLWKTSYGFSAVAKHRDHLERALPEPAPLSEWQRPLRMFRLVNSYGLFANMSDDRPELIIEGSMDLKEWVPYTFRYKPGDPARRPEFVAPHQPRLDWQMWFAALSYQRIIRRPPRERRHILWLVHTVGGILEGNETITALLEDDPFDGSPPAAVRVRLHQYTFTTLEEREATGDWWRREEVGTCLGPVTREMYRDFKKQSGRK